MTLGEIEKSTAELRHLLDFNEQEIARFGKLVEDEGMTPQFEEDYLTFLDNLDRLNELKKKFKGTLFAELAEAGAKRQVRDGRNVMKTALNKEIKKRIAENEERAQLFKAMHDTVPSQQEFDASIQDFQSCLSGINRLIEDTMTKYKFFTSSNMARTRAVVKNQEELYTTMINDFFTAHRDLLKATLTTSNIKLYNGDEEHGASILEQKMVAAAQDISRYLRIVVSYYEFWTYCAETRQRSFSQYPAFDTFRREYVILQRWFAQLEKNLKHCGINSVKELLAMAQ